MAQIENRDLIDEILKKNINVRKHTPPTVPIITNLSVL